MFNEMAAAGLPAPEYHDNAFMLNATIRNGVINETDGVINGDNKWGNKYLLLPSRLF